MKERNWSASSVGKALYETPRLEPRTGQLLTKDGNTRLYVAAGPGGETNAACPPTVHFVPPKEDDSFLPKHLELKALLLAAGANVTYFPLRVSPGMRIWGNVTTHLALPKPLMADDAVLLLRDRAPILLVMNNDVFRFQGDCKSGQLFFSVNDRLHLIYQANLCWPWVRSCSDVPDITYVYDLSDGVPELVYQMVHRNTGPNQIFGARRLLELLR